MSERQVLAIAAVALFFLGRRFLWWYLGVDRAIRALENIDASLRRLPAVKDFDLSSGRRAVRGR